MDLSWKLREGGEAGEEQGALRELEQAKWLHKFYHGTPQPYLSWWQTAQRQVTMSSSPSPTSLFVVLSSPNPAVFISPSPTPPPGHTCPGGRPHNAR